MIRGLDNGAAVHEHGMRHGFASHQEPGSLISGGGWGVQRTSAVGAQ